MLTAYQLSILRHALGLNDPYAPRAYVYRNHYCGDDHDPDLTTLEMLGLMRKETLLPGIVGTIYRCTDEGRKLAIANFKHMQHPRSRRRYKVYLDTKDALGELSFKEFLTQERFADVRTNV